MGFWVTSSCVETKIEANVSSLVSIDAKMFGDSNDDKILKIAYRVFEIFDFKVSCL